MPPVTGVFLIHGLTGSPTEMAPLGKALQRAGYPVAIPLIAGHGAGHKTLLATTWQDWLAGLRHDLRQLAQACDEVVVAGLCVGGMLGALLAAEEDKVRGVVSLSPDLNFRIPGPMMPWTRFLLPIALHVPWLRRHGYWEQKPPYGIKNPRLQQRIARAIAASVEGQTQEYGTFRTYVGTIRELNRLREKVVQNLPRVRCPVLLMHSFEDSMFSIRNVTVMYAKLGSMKNQVQLITDCDHVITVDLRREEVARRVKRFIAGLEGALVQEDVCDEDFYACQISSPDDDPANPQQPKRHDLLVTKGNTVQLRLSLVEDPGSVQAQASRRNGELTTEWRLAQAAIDALAFGLKTQLAVQIKDTSQIAPPEHRVSAPSVSGAVAVGIPTRSHQPSLSTKK